MKLWSSLRRLWRAFRGGPEARPGARPGVQPTFEILEDRAVPAASPYSVTAAGSNLFFVSTRGGFGPELWATNGTVTGTRLVRDINPGPADSGLERLTGVGSTLYFVADDGAAGRELWRSDGTSAGTRLVKDLTPGAAGTDIGEMAGGGGALYFVSRSGSGWALWKSDGSAGGTTRVKDGFAAAPHSLTTAGGRVFFVIRDALGATALWRSDGTANGTTAVRDLGVFAGDGPSLAAVGSTLYFVVANGAGSQQLWKVDGGGSPELVKSFTGRTLTELQAVGGVLYVTATDGMTGRHELWVSSGTDAGTTRVAVFAHGETVVGSLAALGGRVYLTTLGPEGTRLWTTDGTMSGTEVVRLFGGVADPGLTTAGGKLYLAGHDAAYGVELWTSDGTEAGTRRVTDAAAGAAGSWPAGLTAVASALCFVTRTAVGDDLWVSDGSTAGTVPLLTLHLTPPPPPPPPPAPPPAPPPPPPVVRRKAKKKKARPAARRAPARKVKKPRIPKNVRTIARVLVPALRLFKGF